MMYDVSMKKDVGFNVKCGTLECARQIAVLPENIGSVILSEGEAMVFASVAKEADCERVECGVALGFATTSRPDSIAWLEANVEAERIRVL